MAKPAEAVWRCPVCGYLHRGESPPQWCPVCGLPGAEFQRQDSLVVTSLPSVATDRWRCTSCGYVHEGSEPPETCPVCGVPAGLFEPLVDTPVSGAAQGQTGPMEVVILGAGIAGISAAEAIRQNSSGARITVLSKEEEFPTYRLNLTRYLAGEVTRDSLFLHPRGWYEEQNIQVRLKCEATALHLAKHRIELLGGEQLFYDKLVIAMGAHPFVPPLPGVTRSGVTTLRSLADADELLDGLRPGLPVVCVGGGLLGLETAVALTRRGALVTVVEGHPFLLPRQLSQPAARLVAAALQAESISLRLATRITELAGDERVRAVVLEDGTHLPAERVLFTAGVRPNSYLARAGGLSVHHGIHVDDTLRTSDPDVFAVGDVAEHNGILYGLWGPAQFQGTIGGRNVLGLVTPFGGIPLSNKLKVLGLEVFSIGVFEPRDASYQTLEESSPTSYQRFVLHDGRLVGANLIGDASLTAHVRLGIESRSDFSPCLVPGCEIDVLREELRRLLPPQ